MPNKSEKIGIIGVGMVGSALRRYFESIGLKTYIYDKYKKLGLTR
jgi:phosphoglycerate dehydrogenase-like enzyme